MAVEVEMVIPPDDPSEPCAGMPPGLAYRGSDAAIMIYDGVTRATRVARLRPGQTVRVEVMRTLGKPVGHLPFVGDTLP